MGLFSRAYRVLRREIYRAVPEAACQACGACCVSPHVTLVEFCYLMQEVLDRPPDFRVWFLTRVMLPHPQAVDSLLCRFQLPDGRCSSYYRRPLACRLHGQAAMEEVGLSSETSCPISTDRSAGLSLETVYRLLDSLSNLNQRFYLHYLQPYWLSGLNIECWLTILYRDWPQAYFTSLKSLLARQFGPNLLRLAPLYRQRIRLAEKLSVIETFQQELRQGRTANLFHILKKIREDFPETGAYYYYEAEMYRRYLSELLGLGLDLKRSSRQGLF
jgi:Fe-S-cluster containining protein